MNFSFYFTFKWIPRLRERERERESIGGRPAKLQPTQIVPPPLPRSCRPTAQITRRPSFFFFFFLFFSSTLLLPLTQRCRSGCHWPLAHSSQTSHSWRSQPTPPSSPIHKHPRPTSPIASHALTSTGWALILTTNYRSCSNVAAI